VRFVAHPACSETECASSHPPLLVLFCFGDVLCFVRSKFFTFNVTHDVTGKNYYSSKPLTQTYCLLLPECSLYSGQGMHCILTCSDLAMRPWCDGILAMCQQTSQESQSRCETSTILRYWPWGIITRPPPGARSRAPCPPCFKMLKPISPHASGNMAGI
jgi:hypothetical protein